MGLISMAGAPAGNQNAAKSNRMMAEALRRELTQDPEQVLTVVKKLLTCAKAGEAWAMQMVFERVDGKLPQPIVGQDDGPLTVQVVNYATRMQE
jgi:hypothetical protein